MRTLVLGANGLLGSNVVAAAADRGWDVRGTVRSATAAAEVAEAAGEAAEVAGEAAEAAGEAAEAAAEAAGEAEPGAAGTPEPTASPEPFSRLDIRDADRAADLLDEHGPALVVNCAAMTDVDGCEADPDRAHAVNGRAPGALAAACADRAIPFVHVSTDYVFDGRGRTPYVESDEPDPVQVYGESKLAGERAVREADGDALVVRLSFVYGTHGVTGALTGFPAWVRDELADGESLPLFTDQHVTPTRAGQAARVLLDLADRDRAPDDGARGTYHAACRTCLTPHAFGRRIAERMGVSPALVEAGSMADVDRPAERPQHTCLDVSRLEATLDRAQPSIGEDLAAVDDALATDVDEGGADGE